MYHAGQYYFQVVAYFASVFIFTSFSMGLATKEGLRTVVLSKGQLYKTKDRSFWDLLKKSYKESD